MKNIAAIILAAGEGQRLRPFAVTKPKVMLSIADKPILQYVIESLVQNGIRNIVLVVGYRKKQVFDSIGSGEQFGVEITYTTQERQVGTAHALAQARDVVENEFLVLSGHPIPGRRRAKIYRNVVPAGSRLSPVHLSLSRRQSGPALATVV